MAKNKRRGPPPKPRAELREDVLRVVVNGRERRKLEDAAAAAGLAFSAWARLKLLEAAR